jgi:hypothetical protein
VTWSTKQAFERADTAAKATRKAYWVIVVQVSDWYSYLKTA